MALQPEDEGMFVWPPAHWPLGGAMPSPAPLQIGPDEQIAETAPPLQAAPPLPVAIPPPVEIEMPPEYVGKPPEIEMPAEYVGPGATLPLPQVSAFVDEAKGVEIPPPAGPVDVVDPNHFDPMSPSTWAQPIGADDLHGLSKRDPAAYVQHSQAIDQINADTELGRIAVKAKEKALRDEQTHRETMDTMAKANELRDRVLNTKIDAGRWRKSRTLPQSVMAMLSVVIGGLYQSRKGGPNIGLEIIDKAIDRDIAEQQANLDKDRSMVAELRAQGMNDFQIKQTMSAAVYQRAIEEIQTTRQDFVVGGTTERNLAQQQLEYEARVQAAAEAARRNKFDEDLKIAEAQRKLMETRSEIAKRDAEIAKMRPGAGGGGTAKGMLSPQEIKAEFGIDVPGPMSQKDVNTRLEGKVKSQTLATGANSTGLSKEELERYVPGLELTVKDDAGNDVAKPYLAVGLPAEVEGLRKKTVSTKKLVRLMDEALRIRTGWSSDAAKSDEWRKLKANWAAAIGEAKGPGGLALGVLTGPDMELAGEYIGTKDPTEFRDPSAGILKARQNLINALNDEAGALVPPGATLKRFDIQEPKLRTPEESKSDENFKEAQEAPTTTKIIELEGRGYKRGDDIAKVYAKYVEPGAEPTIDNVVLPRVRKEIADLEQTARSSEDAEKVEEALGKLHGMMENGGNTGTQQAARAALERTGRRTESYEEITGKSAATTRETVPPPRSK